MTAIEHGFATPNLVLGIGAALHYNNPEDPQSVQLQQAISEVGVAKALEQFSGISADDALAAQILEAYNTVA
jgi:mannitol-1-phosphate 5-dehydrogenase